jgi:hypothetical protein
MKVIEKYIFHLTLYIIHGLLHIKHRGVDLLWFIDSYEATVTLCPEPQEA